MSDPRVVQFTPYARLLTMLGDQLIKNERVALIEIIKNSYDADASWARVTFEDFDAQFQAGANAKIIVEDDGDGMSEETLSEHWASPATPIKKIGKQSNDTTVKGRKIQGEKGIGRFAILKLGKTVNIVSRPRDSSTEFTLDLDLSPYDDDFLEENGKPKKLMLSDVKMKFRSARATKIVEDAIRLGKRKRKRPDHGTRITISNLRSDWNEGKVSDVYDDLIRLQSIFLDLVVKERDKRRDARGFEVFIYRGEEYQDHSEWHLKQLTDLISQNTVLRIENGAYDESAQKFQFKLNARDTTLALSDADLMGLRIFRDRFGKSGERLRKNGTKCGPFTFGFYIFDFSKDARGKHQLNGDDKDVLKKHRIYLYRDDIRVYPYGDPKDDWLEIDAYRGTISAGQFLSNDQVVGFVNITQRANPQLKDKTNREGLIDTGAATEDFTTLIKLLLAWIRQKPYAQYRKKLEDKGGLDAHRQQRVFSELDAVAEHLEGNTAGQAALARARKFYQTERNYLVQRAETTEQLAGVGLSVETASHDIMSVMNRALGTLDSLLQQLHAGRNADNEEIERDLTTLRGMLSFIESQLKNIQLLFKSSKQRRRDVRVTETLEKVHRLFQTTLTKEKIDYQVVSTGSPLVAKTTDAVLLQLFLNLFDNAVYWLETKTGPRHLLVTIDGDEQVLIFSDDGPGISEQDAPYIFEPFYSGRGDEGRGLGLYIAKQLLERHEYTIELADLKSQRKLRGANFVVSFGKGGEND